MYTRGIYHKMKMLDILKFGRPSLKLKKKNQVAKDIFKLNVKKFLCYNIVLVSSSEIF